MQLKTKLQKAERYQKKNITKTLRRENINLEMDRIGRKLGRVLSHVNNRIFCGRGRLGVAKG